MYNNKLTRNYQSYMDKPNHMNNQLFNNNPLFESNIYDQNFYQKMQMTREEQKKRINKVSDLKLSKDQITEYVIAPIKVAKSNSSDIQKLFDTHTHMITQNFIEQNWWNKRTNAPYKTILKNENWNKDFKSNNDLIVHKVSSIDKIGLMDDYKKLVNMLEKHNNDLKVIYSASNETEYKKKFKHVNKYKYKMKYDPKSYNDLKNYYKTEQKKYERDQMRIDELITKIMDNDDISKEYIKQIETELLNTNTQKKKKKKKNIDYEKKIDKQLQEFIHDYDDNVIDSSEPIKKKISLNRTSISSNPNHESKNRIKIVRRTQNITELPENIKPKTQNRIKIIRRKKID